MFYTKREACEILLQGTPAESLARIEAEREDRKYNYGYITMAYEGKLSDAPIEIREVHWYE